jgi:hypothetical protein
MSGQGGPHGWTADDTVVTQGNTTVALTDNKAIVVVKTSGDEVVTTIDRTTGKTE